jgi:hypothetical protein
MGGARGLLPRRCGRAPCCRSSLRLFVESDLCLAHLGRHERLDEHRARSNATTSQPALETIKRAKPRFRSCHGRVRLITAGDAWEGAAGDDIAIPTERHAPAAVEDSIVNADRGERSLAEAR